MSKEDMPANHENAEKTAEEIENAERLKVLNEWLNWIEEQNGGKPVALLVQETLVEKVPRKKKSN